MEVIAKTSVAVEVSDELTTLLDWTLIEDFSDFTIIVENSDAGGDDIIDIQVDTSEDGGVTESLDQHNTLFADPIEAAESKKETFIQTAKFIRVRAKCDTDKATTATAYLLADSGAARICTLADIKDRLGISSTEYDITISRIIAGLSSLFDNYTMRKLLLNADDETQNWTGGGGQRISLPRYPIVSITSIKEASDYDFENADVMTEDTDYRVLYDKGIIYKINGRWFTIEDSIEIKYRGGFVSAGQTPAAGETAMPDDLREAAIMQASFIFKRRNDIGLISNSSDGGSISSFSAMDLLPMVKDTLEKNRRLVL